MIFVILLALTGLTLSSVAIYYSVLGLTAIFAAAFWPIVIMGTTLEVSKLVAASWLKARWTLIPMYMKIYMSAAVVMLMLITSMGIFGVLSKAHSDQNLVSGDVQNKIAIFDEKIKTARENIEASRKQLAQMDAAVDQTIARSTSELSVSTANNIRKSQRRDRVALANEIERNQKLIVELNDQSAPIRAEVRKVEAEVGPIKYIAAFIYGEDPDANVLEKAVTWVIITIIFVFDPMAILLLLGSQMTYQWYRKEKQENDNKKVEASQEVVVNATETTVNDELPSQVKEVITEIITPETSAAKEIQLELVPKVQVESDSEVELVVEQQEHNSTTAVDSESLLEKTAKRIWKHQNPNTTIKAQEIALKENRIADVPWHEHNIFDKAQVAVNEVDFGTEFPIVAVKNAMFVRVDQLPTRLYRFTGDKWIEIDKNNTDSFTFNDRYIDHLIAKISNGEYDPDLLNPAEQQQVELRLKESEN